MKKNYKKYLLMALSLVLVSAISIIGTIAFLIDGDSKVNTFTVGDISVSVTEDTAVIGEGGEVKSDDNGADYTKVMPGDYLKKEVKVANTGTNPAYVAVTVTINNADKINLAIDEFYGGKGYSDDEIQAIYDSIFDGFGINYNPRPGAAGINDARGVIDGTYGLPNHTLKVDFAKTIKGSTVIGATNWFIAGKEKAGQYWVDGPGAYDGYYTSDMSDYQIRYTYYMLLNEGEETVLFNGLNIPQTFNKEQLAMFAGLNIDVEASAIQADNFYGDAKAAFTALKEEMADGFNDGDVGTVYTPVATAQELVESLENGEDIVMTSDVKINPANLSNAYGTTGINVKNGQTINGGGNTLDIKGAGGTWDSGINTTGGTIKNLTVTGSFRGIFVNHNSTHSEPVVLENVTIDGTVYTISCDQGANQNLIATDSTFKGWTSYAATLGNASFTNCYFGEGSGYAYMRPYAPTTFVGCEFEAGFEMDPRAKVVFENCTFGGVALTADNLSTLVTSNIANASVK